MIKKTSLLLLTLIVLAICVFMGRQYLHYVNDPDPNKKFIKPGVHLSLVQVTSITDDKIEATLKLIIKNELPFSFNADSLNYLIFMDSVPVIKNRYEKSFVIKGYDTTLISLPITILKSDLISTLKQNERQDVDSIEYRLQASFFSNIIFRKKYDLEFSKVLPLLHLLETKTEKLEIDSLNFKRAALTLPVLVTNRNNFTLKAKDVKYELSLEDNKVIKGAIPGTVVFKKKDISELRIPLTLNYKEVSKTLWPLLVKGKQVNYKLRVMYRLDSPAAALHNTQVIIGNQGTLQSLLKMANKKKEEKKREEKKAKEEKKEEKVKTK